MKINLCDNERLDDLQRDNVKIVQSSNLYAFSSDAVLLSDFVKTKKTDNYLDLCAGTGAVAVLAMLKNKPHMTTLVEIQENLVSLLYKTKEYNNFENFEIVCSSVQEFKPLCEFDVISVNPPYFKTEMLSCHDESRAVARQERFLPLDELASSIARLLKFGGDVFMVHDSSRICDIICEFRKVNLEVKTLRFVHPTKDKKASVVLVHAKKGGRSGLITLPALIMMENGHETEELKKIYNR
ncbi:MAG: methyltransferase [Clostridia bacterium]